MNDRLHRTSSSRRHMLAASICVAGLLAFGWFGFPQFIGPPQSESVRPAFQPDSPTGVTQFIGPFQSEAHSHSAESSKISDSSAIPVVTGSVSPVSIHRTSPTQHLYQEPAADSEAVEVDGTELQGVGIERVFPRLRFDRPVFITGAGDDSGRLFVVEQEGVIRVFSIADHVAADPEGETVASPEATPDIFLDIRDRISRRGNEEGLIGLAFHPDYKNNGQFFVHYSSSIKDMVGIVARFEVSSEDANRADPDSEQIILEQLQPFRNHNGGSIEFGPDGYLYISFGDGGSANDPEGHGQNLDTWLGAILRIDVDRTEGDRKYAIPHDNPFIDVEGVRPEIWAFGLRNVWRFSFDRQTGELWAADVGQDEWEEVNLIERGGNYGWNRYEADSLFREDVALSYGEHQRPVASYARAWGWSITGGYVYRGEDFPQFDGHYFYGDYVSGNLGRIRRDADGNYHDELVRRTGRSIATFGEDDRGELYLASFDGAIYRIVPSAEPLNTFAHWPQKLSETGLYLSTEDKVIAPHLIPYEINAPFWSDGAEKERYLELPEGAQLGYRPDSNWDIPVGTTMVKNFIGQHLRGMRMLETRLIKRTEDGWESATYVWDLEETDAELVPEGRQFELYQRDPEQASWQVHTWHAPSASECRTCHVDDAGFVLGINTGQLNIDLDGTGENQILRWAERGLVDLPTGFEHRDAPRLPSPYDEQHPLELRARVWLDVNCAMCHRPNGTGNANIDLRFEVLLAETEMINEEPGQGNLGIPDALLVAPGEPDRSLLLHRVETLGQGRMPNVATHQVDRQAVQVLREWIQSMAEEGDEE